MASLKPKSAATEAGEQNAVSLGARVHDPIVIPRTDTRGAMRVLGRDESFGLLAEVREVFKSANLIDDRGRVLEVAVAEWNNEIAVRHLAIAVRDPDDTSKPLAPLSQWRDECDDEQIAALWGEYQDLRDRLDPLGDESILAGNLTATDVELMRDAVKKKEPSVLLSFGSRKLASFLLSSVEQPAA